MSLQAPGGSTVGYLVEGCCLIIASREGSIEVTRRGAGPPWEEARVSIGWPAMHAWGRARVRWEGLMGASGRLGASSSARRCVGPSDRGIASDRLLMCSSARRLSSARTYRFYWGPPQWQGGLVVQGEDLQGPQGVRAG